MTWDDVQKEFDDEFRNWYIINIATLKGLPLIMGIFYTSLVLTLPIFVGFSFIHKYVPDEENEGAEQADAGNFRSVWSILYEKRTFVR